MICPVKLKTSAAFPVFSSLLCGLLISGCSSGQTEAQRTAFKPYSRRPRRSSDTSAEARSGSSSDRMFQSPVQPASAPDVLLAQKVIRDHLHAFGSNDFHRAYSILTPRCQQNMGGEDNLRSLITSTYSDFMHVERVRWDGFAKNQDSGDIRVLLSFQARGGGITRATYVLHAPEGHYMIDSIDSNPSYGAMIRSGPPRNHESQVEDRMFSGVLFSPTSRHRVLDSPAASL